MLIMLLCHFSFFFQLFFHLLHSSAWDWLFFFLFSAVCCLVFMTVAVSTLVCCGTSSSSSSQWTTVLHTMFYTHTLQGWRGLNKKWREEQVRILSDFLLRHVYKISELQAIEEKLKTICKLIITICSLPVIRLKHGWEHCNTIAHGHSRVFFLSYFVGFH